MPIHLTCSTCDKPMSRRPLRVRERNYCTATCRQASLTSRKAEVEISADNTAALVPLLARDGSVRAYALVDAADAEWASQWAWRMTTWGYAVRSEKVDGRQHTVWMHRDLLGLADGRTPEVDHINRNKLDNRRANLRTVTHAQNGQNFPSRRGSSSVYRGVYWDASRGKWHATIRVNNKSVHVGRFSSETEAAEASRVARKLWMPFATE